MSANQRPRIHVAPTPDSTFGDLAADLARDYGLVPDPWQRMVLEDWLGVTLDRRWSSLTCGLSVPRQNGKNAVIEIRELFGAVGLGEKILHTAHEVKTARKAFKRLQYFFGRQVNDPAAKFPELNARVVELRNVNGQEAIHLDNGGSVEIVARSKNSGRGFTADVLVMDEAQEMSDEDIEALMPTTSAAPLGNPQWIFTGTPPGPKANGEVFTRTRIDALSGHALRTCWHEWSACDPDVSPDLDSRAVWLANNPGLETGRLQIDVVEGERARFSSDGFARERLGVWSDSVSRNEIIPAAAWTARRNPQAEPEGQVVFGLSVKPDRSSGSLGVSDGRHVEIIDRHDGTAWIIDRLIHLTEKHGASVAIDKRSAAGSFIPALEAAGVTVVSLSTADVVQACGTFFDAATEGELVHIGDPPLDAAVAGADIRPVGDAWVWSRKTSAADIEPLNAVTFARFVANASTPAPPMPMFAIT